MVPAPKIGEQTRFLRGDGTWNVIPESSSVLLIPVLFRFSVDKAKLPSNTTDYVFFRLVGSDDKSLSN